MAFGCVRNCGRLVDADANNFTVEILIGWKRAAQERAFRELVAPWAPSPTSEAERVSAIVAADKASFADGVFDKLFALVHSAAAADLTTYTRAPIWSGTSLELTLRILDDEKTPPFNISRLPPALEVAPEVTIVAPPGTGKTTTLLQLARHVLSANSIIPLYFRLGDWAAGSAKLLASLRERAAFRDLNEGQLRELAQRGRLLLLLDGWNELDPPARKKLRVELDQIRHDWPYVRIVATTRRQMLDIPTAGPRVEIEPLSEDQELAIASALSGRTGEKVVDDAWRTPGVRELIATPLYLTVLVSGASKGSEPNTKESILRLFVQQHERASDHAEALLATLHGCHTQILVALAARLTTTGGTAMPEDEARRVVMEMLTSLRQQGQLSAQPEPLAVLEVLTSHHTLMRSGASNGAISFQHQQFQEWFASHDVADIMQASANGDASARTRLRTVVLDQPAWEEAIFFATERVSREPDGVSVVAHAVRLALPIDPMLAAEMIYRSSAEVWEIVRPEVMAFVNRWHRPGKVDRAVRFMIMTGRPEFEPRIWPLASSENTQVQLPTLRIAPRFRPAVLGNDLRVKIGALPERTREHLLALIASESGVDGMDLAVELAKADPSPRIQAEVVQYLQFRRADRHVALLLAAVHDETWALVAQRSYAEEIHDPAAASRLRAEREKAITQAMEPATRLHLLLEQSPDYPERDAGIAAAVADPDFPVRDSQGGSLFLAQERAPTAVLEGLKRRVEAGLELPFHADDLLEQLDTVDDGPIAAAILDISKERRESHAVPALAGPRTVGALLDQYLACAESLRANRANRILGEKSHRLRERLSAVRPGPLVAAVVVRAESDDPAVVASLASIVAQHGDSSGERQSPIVVDAALKPELIQILRRWVEVVVSSPSSRRYQLNEVSNAIGRFGFCELLPELRRLLDEELRRHAEARAGFMDVRRRGDIEATSDALMYYTNQYRRAFASLGGEETARVVSEYLEDREFGFDAALVLKNISDKMLNVPEPGPYRRWPWFDEVEAARAMRVASPRPRLADAFAEPIFAAVDRLATPETDKEGQQLAIKLARIALAMPHSDQDALIARVLALPQPLNTKRELLAATVLDGRVLDVALVTQAVDEWLEEAAKDAWQKRQNMWEIEPWLELLPFTTRPEAVIEGLTKVKAFYGDNYRQRWECVLTAVAAVPGPAGEALLAALASTHKDIASSFEWMRAILGRDSLSAVLLFVDLVIEGVFGNERDGGDAWHSGRELAAYAKKFPELKAELKRRYESVAAGPARAMLEHFFGEIGGEEDLIAMIKKYAAAGQAYDGRMSAVVRAVTIDEVPVSEGSSTFNIHSAPVAQVRKVLFGMLDGPTLEAALAKRCLISIDKLRDEYGIAASDTRHPDIMSEKPWPEEAGGA